MDWKRVLLKLLKIVGLSTLISTLLMGLFGYLIAGKAGLGNSLLLGALFGFIGSLLVSGYQISAYFWSGYASRYGQWHFDEMSKPKPEDKSKKTRK